MFLGVFSGFCDEDAEALPSRGNVIIVDINGNGNYTDIQEAIDDASDGDLIRVYDGIYNSNLNIRKEIIILGNGSSTIITPDRTWDNAVVDIKSDNVTLSNIKIMDPLHELNTVILLRNYRNNNISDVIIDQGQDGIHLSETHNSTITNTIIRNISACGIEGWRTNNLTLEHNYIDNCSEYGVYITCTNFTFNNNPIDKIAKKSLES